MKQDSVSLECQAVTTLKMQEKNNGGRACTGADTTFVATETTAITFLETTAITFLCNPIMLPGAK